MKRMALFVAGFLIYGAAICSASGDLSVTGNMSVGITGTTTAKLQVFGTTKVDSVIHANGSHYNVLTYVGLTANNGIKIKTNIPLSNGFMPTVIIEGYSYGKGVPINLTLSWYNTAGATFGNLSVTSINSYMPPITLADEGGMVVIFIDDRQVNTRITVRAFASGRGETDSIFEGWTATDDALAAPDPLKPLPVRVGYKDKDLIHGRGTHNNVLTYSLNNTPVSGIKIKTNIPFSFGAGMPTLIIEGYCYALAAPIGLTLTWYVNSVNSSSEFYNYAISSSGDYTPLVKLANEGDKVVIFIDDRQYYSRFTVRAFAYGVTEQNSWFEGWSTIDEGITGTKTVTVPYKNKFSGTVSVEGTLSATTKNFDIVDPRFQDEAQRLVHSSLEGPEVGVYYRGEVVLEKGKATIDLPDYFESLTRMENRTVLLTPKFTDGSETLCNVAASEVRNSSFSIQAFGVADPIACNHPVYWEVKAIRSDVDKLQVDQKRTE